MQESSLPMRSNRSSDANMILAFFRIDLLRSRIPFRLYEIHGNGNLRLAGDREELQRRPIYDEQDRKFLRSPLELLAGWSNHPGLYDLKPIVRRVSRPALFLE